MSPVTIVMMGVSGSGKTQIGQQLAAELDWKFFDADDFHSPEHINKMRHGMALTDADRDPWLKTLQALIERLIEQNQSAVLACSALKQSYRDRLCIHPSVKIVYLKGSYDLIQQRLNRRTDHYMSADLLSSQFEILEEPQDALVVDVSQPPEAIVAIIKRQLQPIFDDNPCPICPIL